MVYHIENKERPDNATILQTGENGLVTEIANRPAVYENSKVFMGIYLMSRKNSWKSYLQHMNVVAMIS